MQHQIDRSPRFLCLMGYGIVYGLPCVWVVLASVLVMWTLSLLVVVPLAPWQDVTFSCWRFLGAIGGGNRDVGAMA